MKNSVKLMTSALALGFAMSGFAQDATNTNKTLSKDTAKPKVIIEIPKQAIESGKIIIRDGQVYARIGKADKMADGRAVVFTSFTTAGSITIEGQASDELPYAETLLSAWGYANRVAPWFMAKDPSLN